MQHHFSEPRFLDPTTGFWYDSEADAPNDTELVAVIDEIPEYRDFFQVHILPENPYDISTMQQQENGSYIQPWIVQDKDLEYVKSNLLAVGFGSHRWKLETTPISIEGIEGIPTITATESTRVRINDLVTAIVTAEKTGSPLTSVDFKNDSGEFISLTTEQVYELARQVSAYIEQCFTQEKNLVASVQAATTLTELSDVMEGIEIVV